MNKIFENIDIVYILAISGSTIALMLFAFAKSALTKNITSEHRNMTELLKKIVKEEKLTYMVLVIGMTTSIIAVTSELFFTNRLKNQLPFVSADKRHKILICEFQSIDKCKYRQSNVNLALFERINSKIDSSKIVIWINPKISITDESQAKQVAVSNKADYVIWGYIKENCDSVSIETTIKFYSNFKDSINSINKKVTISDVLKGIVTKDFESNL